MATSHLPAPRVVITTHDKSGTSIFGSDTHVTPFAPYGPGSSSVTVLHTASKVPATVVDPLPSTDTPSFPRPPPAGALMCTVDIPAGVSSPMHRTLSLDYAVVLAGEIVLQLDGGEETVVKTGELMIQRGTKHEWINRGDSPCRILFIMVGSEKVVLEDGKELDAEGM